MRKKFVFHSIYLKFVTIFLLVLWFSVVTSFYVIYSRFYDQLYSDMATALTNKSIYVMRMCDENKLDVSVAAGLMDGQNYEMSLCDRRTLSERYGVTDEEIRSIDRMDVVHTGKYRALPYSVFELSGTYVVIRPNLAVNTFTLIREVIFAVLSLCALIGSVLILFSARMVVRPIKRLSAATKEVAKGNFDIYVRETTQDEIGRLTRDFNKMAKELKSIDYMRKDFVSAVSHEFKTPVTAISGFAKILKSDDITNEQYKEYTDIIARESERLSNLSVNLLKLSELENKVIRGEGVVFSLDEQIRRALLMLEDMWSGKRIELDIELCETEFLGDEDLLNQVWLNLIHNAIKFSFEGGQIKIRLCTEDSRTVFSINNGGAWILPEDMMYIFDRFFKGERSRSKDGNGLGLAIVKKIVEISGGGISCESDESGGTTFFVVLPA